MKAYITHGGEILAQYAIPSDGTLEADDYARHYAREVHGATVEQSCGKPRSYIPCAGISP